MRYDGRLQFRVGPMPKTRPKAKSNPGPKAASGANPQKQLDSFLDKFAPAIASLARAALAKMRRRLPGAHQMVYDNYNALAVGFVPNERPSDAIFSIALYPNYVRLFFLQGAGIPDPDHRLEGNANRVRSIKLESAATLDDPQVISLMNSALNRARVPLDPKQKSQLIIKGVVAKQRPRRPSE
jgi:hypothetical protein